jgi:hypothetical protein
LGFCGDRPFRASRRTSFTSRIGSAISPSRMRSPRGISTRQVGRVGATITTVRAQTVSKLTRDLDEAVRQFHRRG